MEVPLPVGDSRMRLYGVSRVGERKCPWNGKKVACQQWRFTLGAEPTDAHNLTVDIYPVKKWGAIVLGGEIDGKAIGLELAKQEVFEIQEGLGQLLSFAESELRIEPSVKLFARLGESSLG